MRAKMSEQREGRPEWLEYHASRPEIQAVAMREARAILAETEPETSDNGELVPARHYGHILPSGHAALAKSLAAFVAQ